MNTRTSLIILFLILTSADMVCPAPQSVIKCKVKSNKANPLRLAKTPLQIPGTVLSKATNEYHLEVDPNLKLKVKINLTRTSPSSSASQLKLDLYSLDPPKVIKKQIDVDKPWSITFDKKKYLLAVNNCTNTKPAQFVIVIEDDK